MQGNCGGLTKCRKLSKGFGTKELSFQCPTKLQGETPHSMCHAWPLVAWSAMCLSSPKNPCLAPSVMPGPWVPCLATSAMFYPWCPAWPQIPCLTPSALNDPKFPGWTQVPCLATFRTLNIIEIYLQHVFIKIIICVCSTSNKRKLIRIQYFPELIYCH